MPQSSCNWARGCRTCGVDCKAAGEETAPDQKRQFEAGAVREIDLGYAVGGAKADAKQNRGPLCTPPPLS